jgi:hypothetical protein
MVDLTVKFDLDDDSSRAGNNHAAARDDPVMAVLPLGCKYS